MKDSKPKVVDLFSGCGGMSWGLEKSGFEAVAAIDNWEPALRTFGYNHPGAITINNDIRSVDASDFLDRLELQRGQLDVIVGGPPCQGFSKNVPASYRYLDDARNQLFRDYMRFVEELMPKAIVMENVAELYNAYGGQVREELIAWLERLGYKTDVKVLTASNYGVPQKRRRVIFMASRTGYQPHIPETGELLLGRHENQVFTEKVSAWDAISDLPYLEDGEEFSVALNPKPATNNFQLWARGKTDLVHNHVSKKLRPLQKMRYESLSAGQGIRDLPEDIRPKGGYSGAYGRLDFENVAPTITRWVFHPGSGRFGHPREARVITMREAARLQSFTDDFVFLGTNNEIAGQIGNAVPPRLMAALSDEIMRCARQPEITSYGQPVSSPLKVPQDSAS